MELMEACQSLTKLVFIGMFPLGTELSLSSQAVFNLQVHFFT